MKAEREDVRVVSSFLFMGDSLTDPGLMRRRKWCCFPLYLTTDLTQSPYGRFTNGLDWGDLFLNTILGKSASANFKLEEEVEYINHHEVVRNYAQGGLTSATYEPKCSCTTWNFSREVVRNLEFVRNKIEQEDRSEGRTEQEKADTLVIEWSGANDLITVNEKPTEPEVTAAVEARIDNIKELIKHGYQNFILFNLPDISLTPRFQKTDKAGCCTQGQAALNKEREQKIKLVKDQVDYFNAILSGKINKLNQDLEKKNRPTVKLFDVNSVFRKIYADAENGNGDVFEKDKLAQPYIKSKDFKGIHDGVCAARGYAFWDDVHPTAAFHAVLAENFTSFYKKEFSFDENRSVLPIFNRV